MPWQHCQICLQLLCDRSVNTNSLSDTLDEPDICFLLMQVVVMAGGTNDFHATPPPLEEWTSDIINFMNTVSQS